MMTILRTWAAPLVAAIVGICDGIRTRLLSVRPICVQMHRVRGFMEG